MRQERIFRICGHRERVELSPLQRVREQQRQGAQAQLCRPCQTARNITREVVAPPTH